MKKKAVFKRFLVSFLSVICLLNPFLGFVDLTLSKAYAAAALEYEFFWEILKNTVDFNNEQRYLDNFIVAPSDKFNQALKALVDSYYPFGGRPLLQNQFGCIPITLDAAGKAYIPFGYNNTQDDMQNFSIAGFSNGCLVISSEYRYSANISTGGKGFRRPTSTDTEVPDGFYYAFARANIPYVQLKKFSTENDALFNSNSSGYIFQGNYVDKNFFGVFECDCDDSSVFIPPVSSLPSGADVYIPKGALTMSELKYKVGDNFYNIDGDILPDFDPDNPDGGGSSGSLSGDLTIDGKLDVNVNVSDINVNINGGSGNIYEMPDTEFFNSYLDEALEESSGIRRFIADFFGTLPGQITTLICIGLVIAILLRIIGR